MASPFDGLDLKKAQELLGQRKPDDGALEALDFYAGNLWRAGEAWIGARPEGEGASKVLAMIEQGFVAKNVCAEVVNRHRNGVVGREPRWSFVPRRALAPKEEPTEQESALADEAGAALTEWWDARRALTTIQRAVARALVTGRATLRLYVPEGLRDQSGRVAAHDLAAAFDLLRLDLPEPGAAGVIEDPATGREVALCATTREGKDAVEACYLDDQGNTVLRVLGEGAGVGAAQPLPLGGKLLSYELTREALLTPQVRQLQKALNLDLTQMMRNVNLAGSLERIIANAQRPGHWEDKAGNTITAKEARELPDARFITEALPVGVGASAFLSGLPTYGEGGEVSGYANPTVQWRDPVPVTTFTDTAAALYTAILEACDQLHALIAKDATASGESRKQARAEFATSLLLTKAAVDGLLRWLIETATALAAVFCNRAGAFDELRCEAGCIADAGPLSADEQDAIMARMDKGYLSKETGLALLGSEDVDAELARIEEERQASDAAFIGLTNGAGGRVATQGAGQPQPGAAGATGARQPADVLASELGGTGG